MSFDWWKKTFLSFMLKMSANEETRSSESKHAQSIVALVNLLLLCKSKGEQINELEKKTQF
eukprot:UN23722